MAEFASSGLMNKAPHAARGEEAAASDKQSILDQIEDLARRFPDNVRIQELARGIRTLLDGNISPMDLAAVLSRAQTLLAQANTTAATETQQDKARAIEAIALSEAAQERVARWSATPLDHSNFPSFLQEMGVTDTQGLSPAAIARANQVATDIVTHGAGKNDLQAWNGLQEDEKKSVLTQTEESKQLLEQLKHGPHAQQYAQALKIMGRNGLADAPDTQELLKEMSQGNLSANEATQRAAHLRAEKAERMVRARYDDDVVSHLTTEQRAHLEKNGLLSGNTLDLEKTMKYADEKGDPIIREVQATISQAGVMSDMMALSARMRVVNRAMEQARAEGREFTPDAKTLAELKQFNIINGAVDATPDERKAALVQYLTEANSGFSKMDSAMKGKVTDSLLQQIDISVEKNGVSIFQQQRREVGKAGYEEFAAAYKKAVVGALADDAKDLIANNADLFFGGAEPAAAPAVATPNAPPVLAGPSAAPAPTLPVVTPQPVAVPLPPVVAASTVADTKALRNEGTLDAWDIAFENKMEDRLKKAFAGKEMGEIVASLAPFMGTSNVGRQDNLSINEVENAMMAAAKARDPKLTGDAAVVAAADTNKDGKFDMDEIRGLLSGLGVSGGQDMVAAAAAAPPPTPMAAAKTAVAGKTGAGLA